MPSFIQKRRRRWYAVLEIPKDLHAHFGKSRFVRSLETENQTKAEHRVLAIIAVWKKDISCLQFPLWLVCVILKELNLQ